jgi:tetratricopeptide (TPR) repeat protein
MNNINNMNDSIERYLSGVMNKEEELWLMAEMQDNPQLTREIELRRRTNKILSDMSIIELRNKLEIIEMNRRDVNPARRVAMNAAKYAAVVAGAVIISSTLFFPQMNTTPERLYDRHFNSYQTISAARSAKGVTNALFASAMESIRAKDYPLAINYLEQVVKSDENNIESVFMLGVANMEIKKFNEAEIYFSRVIGQNDNLFIEDASWYQGLCFMVTGEKEKAIRQFEYIGTTKSKYSKEAKKLVRKLD